VEIGDRLGAADGREVALVAVAERRRRAGGAAVGDAAPPQAARSGTAEAAIQPTTVRRDRRPASDRSFAPSLCLDAYRVSCILLSINGQYIVR
jgi:hypothetical protein